MSKTFSQFGIPFPLFEGPSGQASQYFGLGICSFCDRKRQHCFRLEIGCAVMVPCPACGAENGLAADDRKGGSCRCCKVAIPFPNLSENEIKVCYDCLRMGKAALDKDTELGMISWEQAFEGITHGVPGLDRADFEMVSKEDGWFGARLSPELMFELLRTPTYNTIQGERWRFCCRRPMVFVGEWSREEFTRRAPDGNGRRYFDQVVQHTMPGLWEDKLHDSTGVYVFRCPSCEGVTAHWDIA